MMVTGLNKSLFHFLTCKSNVTLIIIMELVSRNSQFYPWIGR